MGLTITAKGFDEEIYNSGYAGFTNFRIEIAKAYNSEFGELYKKWVRSCLMPYGDRLSPEKLNRLNELCNDDLDILLQHSDCDGKLTPQECKKIYNITKDLKCVYPQMCYGTTTGKNLFDVFNRALLHCWKRRVCMRFE